MATLFIVASILPATPAQADLCGETGVFQRLTTAPVRGTWGKLIHYNLPIGTTCSDRATFQTQLMVLSPSGLDWVEIGTRRYWQSGIFGGLRDRVFGEWRSYPDNGVLEFYADVDGRTAMRFKVEADNYTPGLWRIYTEMDPSGPDPTWTLRKEIFYMNYSEGYAEVESARFGPDPELDMAQIELHYKLGGWHPWDGVTCRRDDDSEYEPRLPTTIPDELFVDDGPGACVSTLPPAGT